MARKWLSLSCLMILVAGISLSACATTDVLTGAPISLPAKDKATIGDALVQLANNPLISAALDDSAETVKWVNAQPSMDPMKKTLALA